jgi:hypothetical protein
MVLPLIAFEPHAQMCLGAADVMLGRALCPVVVWVRASAVAHHLADYFERFGEWIVVHLSVGRRNKYKPQC